jgi:acetolactate synthase-1/3 small subunit
MKYSMSALVENKPGVLNRVVSLFRRRNFNIDSLTVGRTENPELSRMTILIEGTEAEARKVEKCLYKLPNVVHVEHLHDKPAVSRDLALIKVRVDGQSRPEVMQLCSIFRARVVDVGRNSIIVEITGEEEKIESFSDLLGSIGIIEMVRTGIVAMGRGEHTITPTNGYRRTASRSSRSVL